MDSKIRLTGEGFHKKGGKNMLNSSLTGSSFYLQDNKTETYQTLIQMLKTDLIQILTSDSKKQSLQNQIVFQEHINLIALKIKMVM